MSKAALSDKMFATLNTLTEAEGIIHAGTSAGEIDAAGGSRACLSAAVKKGWAAKYAPEKNLSDRDFRTVYYYRTKQGTEALRPEWTRRGVEDPEVVASREMAAEREAAQAASETAPAEPEPAPAEEPAVVSDYAQGVMDSLVTGAPKPVIEPEPEQEPAPEPNGALTPEQTAEIAAAVIMKAADVVEDWSAVQAVIPALQGVSAADAGKLIAGWMSALPGQLWDDRLPLPE